MGMGASGINLKKILNSTTYINTTLAVTGNSIEWTEKQFNNDYELIPKRDVRDFRWKYTLTGFIHHKFGPRLTKPYRLHTKSPDVRYEYPIYSKSGKYLTNHNQ
ncbi:MAG: hypothetical protein HC906_11220 [Bacteroidales bacterium]|nr:hypothetical protein [Bacteroidales bacterium]